MSVHSSPVFFDSHCHFDFPIFGGLDHGCDKRAGLWHQCREKGIQNLLIPGIEPKQWPTMANIARELDGIYMSIGIHPWSLDRVDLDRLNREQGELGNLDKRDAAGFFSYLKADKHLLDAKCVAIGECGMDAIIDTDVLWQAQVFEAHIQLACELDKPLIIHVRKTHNQTLELLSRYRPPAGGVIHGFTGSIDLARQYWRLGFYLGVGGSITYPRANKTRTTVQTMPLESLLLETDAPDMPLQGKQGIANSPLEVINVAITLAELRGESLEKVAGQTRYNAQRLFGLL